MIGILAKFLAYLQLESDKGSKSLILNKNTSQKKENSLMIEIDEKDNVFSETSEIITKFENGKEIKMEIITQTIPVGKNSAIRKTITERIR